MDIFTMKIKGQVLPSPSNTCDESAGRTVFNYKRRALVKNC